MSMISAAVLVFLTLCCGTGSLLTVLPTQQNGQAPRSVRIQCLYANCPGVSWQGPAITSSPPRFRVDPQLSGSLLTIERLLEQDEGEYFCSCADGRTSGPSNLIVHHLPNFDNVDLNQTFHRGETAAVQCNADLGDPPQELFWIRNGNKVLPGAAQMRVENDGRVLTIENIDDSNAGVYQCVFNLITGPISADITVNVIDPPQPLERVFNPDLPRSLSISFGDAIHLDCRSPEADLSVSFAWSRDNDELRVDGHILDVLPEDVATGAYRCLAYRRGAGNLQHTVLVTLEDTPPIPVNPPEEVIPISAMEQKAYFLRQEFRFRLDRSNLSVQWMLENGEAFDFGSRFTFSVSQTVLRFEIEGAELTDRGEYLVNVSNLYGFTVLRVRIVVMEITKTVVQVHIKEVPCHLIQEYEDRIVEQIADEHKCSICGDVRPGRHRVEPSCDAGADDTTTITITVTLLSQDTLPERRHILLWVEDMTVEAEVCYGADCATAVPRTEVQQQQQEEEGTLVVAVVVAVCLTLFALLLVLLVTVLIWKTHCRHKHRVAQEDATLDQVVVHRNQAGPQPECIAYAVVSQQPQPTQQSTTVTPVTLPYPSPPPHTAPLLPPSSSGTKPEACLPPTAKAKRPQKLYFRSHSYHGSTRTPQA